MTDGEKQAVAAFEAAVEARDEARGALERALWWGGDGVAEVEVLREALWAVDRAGVELTRELAAGLSAEVGA